ncbi:IPT/TIG domain-containing protein [Streptomyces sp. NPDC048639]|uniref:IPT/TIG domain-containing protein n=1 Tax=Streptomyces sp. NPDC048639 TaxID=3365581 RepID=UPI00372041CE
MPITPNQGSTGGGTAVTINGTNLTGTSAVRFGSKLATDVVVVNPTTVTATSPSGSGTVDVTLTTPGGTSNPIPFFYVGSPFKSSLNPAAGSTAGGNTVTLNGTGLSTATNVSFGGTNATPTVVSDSVITVTAPAHAAGPVSVTVTTAGGSNNGLSYTFVGVPTITTVAPDEGPETGGTAVTITGTNLGSTSSVTFDAVAAPFSVINSTTLSAVSPPGTGTVDVVVTNAAGSDTETDGFTYVAGPGI